MAKDEIGGVWRTVGGRRIFIKDGEDLASAMERSGKFQKMVQKDQKLVKEIDDEADEFKRKENENWKKFLENSNDNMIKFLKYDQDQHHEYDGVKAKYIEDEFNKRFGKTQETFKPKAVGAKSFEEHGVAFADKATNERFSNYLRDKYGTDDIDMITTGSEKNAKSLRDEFNKKNIMNM